LRQIARASVIQFAPRIDIPTQQTAPQIIVPDVPAFGSNMVSEDEICMAAMDEYEDRG